MWDKPPVVVQWSTLQAKHGVKPERMVSINASPAEIQADVQIFMCRHSALLETLWAQPQCQTTGGLERLICRISFSKPALILSILTNTSLSFILKCQWDNFFHRIAEKPPKNVCILEQNNPQQHNTDSTELKESLSPELKFLSAFFLRSVWSCIPAHLLALNLYPVWLSWKCSVLHQSCTFTMFKVINLFVSVHQSRSPSPPL